MGMFEVTPPSENPAVSHAATQAGAPLPAAMGQSGPMPMANAEAAKKVDEAVAAWKAFGQNGTVSLLTRLNDVAKDLDAMREVHDKLVAAIQGCVPYARTNPQIETVIGEIAERSTDILQMQGGIRQLSAVLQRTCRIVMTQVQMLVSVRGV